ncbi:MAG TPA: mechanosensitive ion channel family protein [Cellvibrionaceae bacterium]
MAQVLEWLKKLAANDQLWMLQVFTIVFITLILAVAARFILNKLLRQAAKTANRWDDILLESALLPVRTLIWLVGLCWAAEIASAETDQSLLDFADDLLRIGVVVIFTWFLVRFIKSGERNFLEPPPGAKPSDPTTVMALGKLLRISIVITAVLVLLQSLGYSISGVLAFGGVGGIAVGFAAKDLLANFFGGLMVYMDRPFKVGDWIRSPDKEIEGTVEEIGLRQTRIRTFDKRPLYVPNQTFTQISVENPSRMFNRRIFETVGIRYDDAPAMGSIVAEVKAMLSAHEAIDTQQTLMVNFNTFADSSLNFFIYAFTKTTNWAEFHEIKQDVLLKVIDIIDSHEAQCAFPTRTLHMPNEVRLAAEPDTGAGQ